MSSTTAVWAALGVASAAAWGFCLYTEHARIRALDSRLLLQPHQAAAPWTARLAAWVRERSALLWLRFLLDAQPSALVIAIVDWDGCPAIPNLAIFCAVFWACCLANGVSRLITGFSSSILGVALFACAVWGAVMTFPEASSRLTDGGGEDCTGRWVHVDPSAAEVDQPGGGEEHPRALGRALLYVAGFFGEGGARDVTRRYSSRFPGADARQRDQRRSRRREHRQRNRQDERDEDELDDVDIDNVDELDELDKMDKMDEEDADVDSSDRAESEAVTEVGSWDGDRGHSSTMLVMPSVQAISSLPATRMRRHVSVSRARVQAWYLHTCCAACMFVTMCELHYRTASLSGDELRHDAKAKV